MNKSPKNTNISWKPSFLFLTSKTIPRNERIILSLFFFLKISPFFSLNITAEIDLIIFIVLFIIWRLKGHKFFPKKVYIISIIVASMILIQGLLHGGLQALHIIKYPIFFVFTPYLIYRNYGISSFRIIANFVLITSIISLPFWIIQNLSPSINNTFLSIVYSLHQKFPWDSWPRSMLIYTAVDYTFLETLGLYRNSGLYSEPGMFSFWINFAIIIYLLAGEKIFSKKILFLVGILITTFSTGGYMQFFIIAITYFLASSSYKRVPRYILLGVFILFFASQYQRLSFMQPKIDKSFKYETEIILEGSKTTGRFLRLRKGFYSITKYPILGRGISSSSQFENKRSAAFIGNVGGFVGFIARYGVPLGILYFVCVYKGFENLVRNKGPNTLLSIGFFASVMIAFIGQGTPVWNPIIILFFMHGYFHYGINISDK